jgi:hypothetical protein
MRLGWSPLSATPADHEQAENEFRDSLPEYRDGLRDWLLTYSDAARSEAETFELSLQLTNAVGAAHAESVLVELELPDGSEIVDEPTTVGPIGRATVRPSARCRGRDLVP